MKTWIGIGASFAVATTLGALHYAGFTAVQIRVEAIERDELRERLEDAWLIQAPKRLADAYVAERS